jgi:hypothetical protein
MGISNTIPPSRLIQPGVVANTAARPTSPFTGQAIYQVDTNQYLIWNGTAWVIPNSPAQNPQGLELISSQSFSGSTLIEFNNVFSSSYDSYKVTSAVWGSATTNSQFRFHTGTNTPNTDTSYFRYGYYYASGVFTNFTAASDNQQFWGNHYAGSGIISTTEITFFNPFKSERSVCLHQHWDGNSGLLATFSSQHVSLTSFTGFRVYPGSGTLTGRISVYGFRNS